MGSTKQTEAVAQADDDMAKSDMSTEDVQYMKTQTLEISPSVLQKNHIISASERTPFTDAYKILRTQVLQLLEDNDWKTLAVTSPGPNEGKTLTAINLAICLAMEVDYTVMLVEANLLHPNMHTFFGLPPQKGLGDYLLGEATLPEVLFRPSGIEHMVVLPGGRPLQNSSEMLSSPKTAQLVEELKGRYTKRVIIFDLPPVLSGADAVAFVRHADAVLLVVGEGETKEQELQKAVELLDRSHIIGTVLNKVPTSVK